MRRPSARSSRSKAVSVRSSSWREHSGAASRTTCSTRIAGCSCSDANGSDDRRRHDVRRRMVPALVLTAGLATAFDLCRSFVRKPRFLSRDSADPSHPPFVLVSGCPRRRAQSAPSAAHADKIHRRRRGLGMRIRYSWEVPVLGSPEGRSARFHCWVRTPEPRTPDPSAGYVSDSLMATLSLTSTFGPSSTTIGVRARS